MRIVNEFVARSGTPLSIHSDEGSAFESRLFKELCSLLQVKKTRTSPRNPRANGQTERMNRSVLQMIRAYPSDERNDCDLGCLAGAYRDTPQESTRLSPNRLCLGREIRMPAVIMYGQTRELEEHLLI